MFSSDDSAEADISHFQLKAFVELFDQASLTVWLIDFESLQMPVRF
jgi:hypothetical protein